MFAKLKERLGGGAKKLAGKTDLLEGICAACALVSAADGEIEDSEIEALLGALASHETLSAAFKPAEIEAAVNKQVARAKGGMAGKLGLKREIAEAASKNASDEMEMLLMICIDVATADGQIEPQERAVLDQIAKSIGFSASSYL